MLTCPRHYYNTNSMYLVYLPIGNMVGILTIVLTLKSDSVKIMARFYIPLGNKIISMLWSKD